MVFAIVVMFGVMAVLIASVCVLGLRRGPRADAYSDEVDPLFTAGIAVAGSSVALVITLGPMLWAMTAAGIVLLAIGAARMRREGPAEASRRK